MSKFSETELAYLRTQRLGRLATVNQHGEPQVAAVSFHYNPELDTIDIGGYDLTRTQKYRNIAHNGKAAIVIDDVLPPWKPRSLEIRGHAHALTEGGESLMPHGGPAMIRIEPTRINFFDRSVDPPTGSSRDV